MLRNKLNKEDFQKLYRPAKDSHKGMNGRLLVIGGSKLFHASIFWTADVASRIVDLVHFSSPAMENNDLIKKKAKEKFWDGIVVPWEKIEDYIKEDDCVVIGPGMPRKEGLEEGETETKNIVNMLLSKFADKKWVIDGGALQEMDPRLLNDKCIITPHFGELKRMVRNSGDKVLVSNSTILNNFEYKSDQIAKLVSYVGEVSNRFGSVTILLKGEKDVICRGGNCERVEGGNEGMTKGGTGDVLAGLVAALYCKNDAFLSAKTASIVNKEAGDRLYERVGPFFNASDLVNEVPKFLKEIFGL